MRNEHDAAGRGAELLRRAVDGEAGGGEAERSGTGGAGTAARLAVGRGSGRRMRVITSLTCGWRGSCTGRRALVTASGNAVVRGGMEGPFREDP